MAEHGKHHRTPPTSARGWSIVRLIFWVVVVGYLLCGPTIFTLNGAFVFVITAAVAGLFLLFGLGSLRQSEKSGERIKMERSSSWIYGGVPPNPDPVNPEPPTPFHLMGGAPWVGVLPTSSADGAIRFARRMMRSRAKPRKEP